MEKEIIRQTNLFYEINRKDLTAQITKSPNAKGDISLPLFIKYESQDYKITGIKEDSFKNNKEIISISMPNDSYLQSISKNAFSYSSISKLFIPKEVNKLEDDWCRNVPNLNIVTISPSNKNFKYLDEEHQIIVGKKDSELVSISKNVFKHTQISSIFIPGSFEEFEDGWCRDVPNLVKVTISPSNKNFKYLDEEHQIIVGKSDTKQVNFDTIIFASRDIKHVKIPKHIKHIKQCAFDSCENLITIEISEDSELVSISKDLLSSSAIEEFFIPAKVEKIEDKWCRDVSNLTKVTISPSNKNFKYLDDERQIIVGKSDTGQNIFDTIIFANRNITHAKIPKYIKYIKQRAFENCNFLNTVKFAKDSKLIFIGSYSFSNSSLKRITIPKSVCEICKAAFYDCDELQNVTFEEGSKLDSFERRLFMSNPNLETVKIPENSSLRSIHRDAFNNTKIDHLFIPASVEKIEDEWCKNNSNLEKVTISPSNKNFKYLDSRNQIIVGKSDPNQNNFDTIIFANRDIIHAKIPNTIKHVYSFAFENCRLQKVEFSEDSEIVSICHEVFYNSLIRNLYIPASIEELDDGWCRKVPNLNIVTISPSNKNFKYLDEEHQIIVGKSDTEQENFDTIIFASRDIKHVKIPKHIKYIKQNAFERCKYLKTVEIEKDSELISFGFFSFSFTAIQSITIPKNVRKLGRSSFFCCENLEYFSLEDGSKLKSIEDCLLFSCKNLNSIEIPINSSFTSIHESAFSFSYIKELFIPKTVEELEDGWCGYASQLQKVTVSSENKNFKYLDAKHQIIVGKSDVSKDIFDIIVFANRNIKYAQIPKYIKSDAFKYCKKLKIIDIPDDSEIDSIGRNAVASTSLINFKFPKKICKYKNSFLYNSKKIWYIEFLGDVFIDDKDNSLFDCLNNLILISFPNVKEMSRFIKKQCISSEKEFTMFANAGSKLSFPNFSNDDFNY